MIKNIKDSEIENGRKVLKDHVVNPLTYEGALESLYFCILSQATPWEKASELIYKMRDVSHQKDKDARGKTSSLQVLSNKKVLNRILVENGWRFHHNKRLDESCDHFANANPKILDEIINADENVREKYSYIKWLSRKTFSFWHLCLGGTNLLALDVYVMRGLSELGINMKESYHTSKSREDGQNVRGTPSKKEYLEIEAEARSLFSKDKRFLQGDKVNMALVDSVLWWKGANRGDPQQVYLFGNGTRSWMLPYAECS